MHASIQPGRAPLGKTHAVAAGREFDARPLSSERLTGYQ